MPFAGLAAHDQQMTAGAQMEQYGGWLRAAWYRKGDETEEAAVRREVLTVRNSVGLFDASPLGKIEVKGPDAAEFLQRMYVNGVRNLKVGRLRYGLMQNQPGVVSVDGWFARLVETNFMVGTKIGREAGWER